VLSYGSSTMRFLPQRVREMLLSLVRLSVGSGVLLGCFFLGRARVLCLLSNEGKEKILPSMGADLPLISRGRSGTRRFRATVCSLRASGSKRVLLRRGWTSMLSWRRGSYGHRLTSLMSWRLTAKGCLLRTGCHQVSLLEASLAVKATPLWG
jgi:hypothetical protein